MGGINGKPTTVRQTVFCNGAGYGVACHVTQPEQSERVGTATTISEQIATEQFVCFDSGVLPWHR